MAACIMRAIWSDAPPAPAATTMSIDLVGSHATAGALTSAAAAMKAPELLKFYMLMLPYRHAAFSTISGKAACSCFWQYCGSWPQIQADICLIGLFAPDNVRAPHHRLHFSEGHIARQIFHAAIGSDDNALGRHIRERLANALRNNLRRLNGQVRQVDNAKNNRLGWKLFQHLEIKLRLSGLNRDLRSPRVPAETNNRSACRARRPHSRSTNAQRPCQ